ncbi:DNA Primase [Rhizobium phage vB_RglS_P106B]|uniref:DNA Primase n=1 Tax=Rhizobium phage vB_RglS_P106B TaxID=1458697 RepID=W6E8P3_9CAUD|nr:DNA primase [Rhizobium phage vB_RglS_P106B]AHJ10754.1 DNA Primase [Rhizobium phage vB_RglS_P106B]
MMQTMTQSYSQAAAYVTALTGEPVETAAIWWRCIHDTNKGIPAHKYFGTLAQVWETLCRYNADGWGIFTNINAFAADVQKHELPDVWFIRTHVVDLDNLLTAQQNYERAAGSQPAPSFAVQSSPGKFHVYWPVQPYQGNERYTTLQRKLRQVYDGDKAVIDPTRVLRVPGFLHLKNPAAPHMVVCWALNGNGWRNPVETLEAAYQHVNVIDGAGGRHQLGDAELSAPSLDWLKFGMSLIDPNNLDRGEWISLTAAFKQSGWLHADDQALFNIWSEWCARYGSNDVAENLKQWNSIRETEVGWKAIQRKAPTLAAYEKFGFKQDAPKPVEHQPQQPPSPDAPQPEPETQFPDILSEYECKQYFKNCYFIERMGEILTPRGRFMNATKFNGTFGGKIFVIDPNGKTTDEPWKAALRSTLWTVPKVDHVRFVPEQQSFTLIEDQLGRKGVNTYIPIRIKSRPGDVTPWLRHMELMLPVESDRHEIYRYFAHNVKYPGFKIPWAPMIQSTEGVGKGFIQEVMETVLGEMYTYSPKAQELVNSGSTFNAWMRAKLMIIVNEIKVDERRELIEILKPMISDKRIEIQSKGIDQEQEDNPANWLFFSNYKDAIPINQSGRRYAIFYSSIQSKADLLARGMDDNYFNALFQWLRNGGSEFIAHWLLNYPVDRGAIPMRAPDTSSRDEAIKVSRGPIEIAILNAIEDGLPGFRGGYVSVLATMARLKQLGVRTPAQSTVQRILEAMGYHDRGRAVRQYAQESMQERTQVYAILPDMPVAAYGRIQGYE